MFYEQTRDNLKLLMTYSGALKIEQVNDFFSDCVDGANVTFHISQFARMRVLDVDEKRGIIRAHGAPVLSPGEEQKRIKAFNVIRELKSKKVRDVRALKYPYQFICITEDDRVFVVAVCNSEADMYPILAFQDATMIPGTGDVLESIAVVRDAVLGKKLLECGFSEYCTINAAGAVSHYTKENLQK